MAVPGSELDVFAAAVLTVKHKHSPSFTPRDSRDGRVDRSQDACSGFFRTRGDGDLHVMLVLAGRTLS